jgi:hypothetical protein
MTILTIGVFLSALSFYAYVVSYFVSPHMKNDFKRFKLEKIGLLTIVLELLGATGLLVGLQYNILLIISSLGLALLMMCGLIVRIIFKDSIIISIPAIFFFILNALIFWESISFYP